MSLLFTLLVGSLQFAAAQDKNLILQKDVPFVPGGGHDQQMDIFLPEVNHFPLVLFLHEGSLTSGDKNDTPYAAIGRNFARHGIGFIAANYRLGPSHKWPAMAEDCAAAFAWMKRNAGEIHADPGRLFILGHSSGALIAAIVSTDDKYLKQFGCELSDIAGCIPMGTMLNPSYDTDSIPPRSLDSLWERFKKQEVYESLFETAGLYRDADPSRHITKNAPPFLVLIAESEQIQPPILEQANRFALSMKRVNVDVQIQVLKSRKHMTAMEKMAEPEDPTLLQIVEFVKNH